MTGISIIFLYPFFFFFFFFFNSQLQDVRPPTIICPSSISVSTDLGKATAKVCLPKAAASDNSGQQPTITTSVGAESKDFIAQSTPHQVVYTARDAAGLESKCTLQITVSGQ